MPNPAVPNPAVPTFIELPDLQPLIDRLKFKCKDINKEYKRYNALLSIEIKTELVKVLKKKGREVNKKYEVEIHGDYVKFQMDDGTVGFEPFISFIKAAHAIKLKKAYEPYINQVNNVLDALSKKGLSKEELKKIGGKDPLSSGLIKKIKTEINLSCSSLSASCKLKLIKFMTASKEERKDEFGNYKGLHRRDTLAPVFASAMGILVQGYPYVERMIEVIDHNLEVELKKLKLSAIENIVVSGQILRRFVFESFKELLKNFTVKELLDSATFSGCTFNNYKCIGITVEGKEVGKEFILTNFIGQYSEAEIVSNNNDEHLKSGINLRFFAEKLDARYFGCLPTVYYFSNQWEAVEDGVNLGFEDFKLYVEKVSKGRFKVEEEHCPPLKTIFKLIDIVVQNQPLNQILYGPPGSGKTYNAVNHALSIALKKDLKSLIESQKGNDRQRESDKADFDGLLENGQIRFVTFHQSYSYEDFVEGIKARVVKGNIEYYVKLGVFKQICLDASAPGNSEKNYVLIIDEINRGNISKIFGELITLIEDSKRIGNSEELRLNLLYSSVMEVPAEPAAPPPVESDAAFGVPKNVYIIGTMNTADKSIALVDLALRRRFTFIEYPADPTLLEETDGIDLKEILKMINKRIEFLLGKDHSIGHSYLMGKKKKKEVLDVFRDKIIPLLCEYFHNDFKKICWVLGDHEKWKGTDETWLVHKKKVTLDEIFGRSMEDELEGKENEMYELKQILKELEVGSLLGIYLNQKDLKKKLEMIEAEKVIEAERVIEIAEEEEEDDDDDDHDDHDNA